MDAPDDVPDDAPDDAPDVEDSRAVDDSLDKCRHGKTAAEYCEQCDNERIDLSDRVDLTRDEARATDDERAP